MDNNRWGWCLETLPYGHIYVYGGSRCLDGVLKVPEKCLEGVWMVSGSCV